VVGVIAVVDFPSAVVLVVNVVAVMSVVVDANIYYVAAIVEAVVDVVTVAVFSIVGNAYVFFCCCCCGRYCCCLSWSC